MNEPILFVDDEPHVLSSIRRQLGRDFEILTATSGPAALEALAGAGPVAVVVSDMRMPDMSGIDLMRVIRDRHPLTVRMMLSGQADLESTIAAVNDGHIFRFVTKPADARTLRANLDAALEQYRLVTTREELLEKTLEGLVGTLNDILGLANPVARQRSLRVFHYVAAISEALQFQMPWELRLAALLSQVGCVTLPPSILDKVYRAEPLSPGEEARYRDHPRIAARLIGQIPQLGPVAGMIIRQQSLDPRLLPDDEALWDVSTRSAVILAAATALDESMATGHGPTEALERLAALLPGLPPRITRALQGLHLYSNGMAVQYVTPSALTPGMVVDQDVLSPAGEVVLSRGAEVTWSHLEHINREIRQLETSRCQEPSLRVLVPA